jgi:hypothetical protein
MTRKRTWKLAARWRREQEQKIEVRCCMKQKKVSKAEAELIPDANTRIHRIFAVDVVRRHSDYY